ncbi:fimbrial protein [Escherichia coli]|uniref:fimbrial protein n=1 Tax=Escherichia coli TaxID=562 RepID=UPI00189E46A1|nr:fimbrial protein [Escherichia coli]MDB7002844.1 fimbrial protein [Escherichia coli]MDB7018559.1 fimbrial protein [Escherichia coli]CAD5757223.1 PixH protein [Escherichia coli]CAD5758686.1 PixH protein [Escherichia coli]
MYRRIILSVFIYAGTSLQVGASPSFPPPGLNLPEYWGEESVWWDGRTNFKGQVIAPTCTLAMEDRYQAIDMGVIPLRILQNTSSGPKKKFHLRLRNCELARTGSRIYTPSHIRVTFDGLYGKTRDRFLLTGQAEGINLQIIDNQGHVAHAGKPMPPLLLNADEEELNYTLRIVRNGYPLKAGNYYAMLRFKVDYE